MTAIAAIVLTGVVAALVTGAYNRAADIRTRRLEAADALLAVLVPALIDLGEVGAPVLAAATAGVGLQIVGAKPLDVAQADLQSAIRELELRNARVDLLFGPLSAAADAAHECVNGIRNALGALLFAQSLDRQHVAEMKISEQYNEAFRRATEGHVAFANAVRRDVFRLTPRMKRLHLR